MAEFIVGNTLWAGIFSTLDLRQGCGLFYTCSCQVVTDVVGSIGRVEVSYYGLLAGSAFWLSACPFPVSISR